MVDPRSYVLIDPKERRDFGRAPFAVMKVATPKVVVPVQLPGGCLLYRPSLPWKQLVATRRHRMMSPTKGRD
jgi:hypothetical protein